MAEKDPREMTIRVTHRDGRAFLSQYRWVPMVASFEWVELYELLSFEPPSREGENSNG
jgi:hypothetical protein